MVSKIAEDITDDIAAAPERWPLSKFTAATTNSPSSWGTTNPLSIAEMQKVMLDIEKMQRDNDEAFNAKTKNNPCSMCGHIMNCDRGTIYLCSHQYEAVRQTIPYATRSPVPVIAFNGLQLAVVSERRGA